MKFSCLFFLANIYIFSALGFSARVTSPIYSPISEDVQGITQTNEYWFISNTDHIFRISKNKKLVPRNFYPPQVLNYKKIPIPKYLQELGYNHFGGISIFKDWVIVALERVPPMKILFFNINTLELEKTYNVPKKFESLSWVAGGDMYIYFSENRLSKKNPLHILNIDTNELKTAHIDKKITKIQGGTYSSSRNKLLIASDAGTRKGGVFQIDLTTFTAKKEIEIRYNRGFPAYQEIEGLTFNDRKDDSKVTVLMLDNNLVEDSMQFIEVSNFW